MRPVILAHLKAHARQLGTFRISDQLPWYDNGAPLYHHNMKHIYVDTANSQQTPAVDALDQAGFVDETTTVSVYFANDAKKLPAEYDAVVDVIKQARTVPGTAGYTQRTVSVVNTYLADVLLTHVEFSFRKTITN